MIEEICRKVFFQLLPICPRDHLGNYWMLEFPSNNWKGHWFKDGRYVEGWFEVAMRSTCPEGEDRAADYMLCLNGLPIFSRRFGESFEKRFPGAIQFLPFVYGPPSGAFEKRTHCIGQVLHVIDCIDRENALISIMGGKIVHRDHSLIEREDARVGYPVVIRRDAAINYPVFRTKFSPVQIYVRSDVRQFIEENGFTGFRFDESNPIVTTPDDPIGPDGKNLHVKAEIERISAFLMSQVQQMQDANQWYKKKTRFMKKHLGAELKTVTHAIVPFGLGGGLDLYYYPQEAGCAIATKDLSPTPDEGPSNQLFQRYEMVMFTKEEFQPGQFHDEQSPFGAAMTSINAVLEYLGRYALQSELNPGDTLEFPTDMEVVGGRCMIVDALTKPARNDGFGLMVAIEIHRNEMKFCQRESGKVFLQMMKDAGIYPNSNLNRQSLVD